MKHSAGIVLYRGASVATLEVLIAHPGGPLFRRRQSGAWTFPKGLVAEGEPMLDAARREFAEETGFTLAAGPALDLGEVKQKGGKRVHAFAVRGDVDLAGFRSNRFAMEWPPRSGRQQEFAEVDELRFVPIDQARALLNPAQAEFLDRLIARVAAGEA